MELRFSSVVSILARFLLISMTPKFTCVQGQPDSVKVTLPANYSKEHRPTWKHGEATLVTVNIHVRTINPIKTIDMDFRLDMTLTQRWTDDRLTFPSEWFDGEEKIILPSAVSDQIWHPRPYIVNAKQAEVGELGQKFINVYVFRDHTVQYTINIYATIACAINYKYFPVDSQLCPMYLESLTFDQEQVQFEWSKKDAFTINGGLAMPQFLPRVPPGYSVASVPRYNQANNFSQCIAYFRFDRLFGNHMIQTFAPCSLIVCLSWFSFWMELNALSARMSLLITAILILVTQFSGLRIDHPPVDYIKAVDIFMAVCMVFVFAALCEYVLAKVINRMILDANYKFQEEQMQEVARSKVINEATIQNAGKVCNQNLPATISTTGRVRLPLKWIDPTTQEPVLLWKRLDNISKWGFPTAFFIFCAIYWTILFIHRTLEQDPATRTSLPAGINFSMV